MTRMVMSTMNACLEYAVENHKVDLYLVYYQLSVLYPNKTRIERNKIKQQRGRSRPSSKQTQGHIRGDPNSLIPRSITSDQNPQTINKTYIDTRLEDQEQFQIDQNYNIQALPYRIQSTSTSSNISTSSNQSFNNPHNPYQPSCRNTLLFDLDSSQSSQSDSTKQNRAHIKKVQTTTKITINNLPNNYHNANP